MQQISEYVMLETLHRAADGLGLQLPIGGVRVRARPILGQPILGIVRPGHRSGRRRAAQPIAVAVVSVHRLGHAVFLHLLQPPGEIVAIVVRVRYAPDRLDFLCDPAERVPGVLDLQHGRAADRRDVPGHLAKPVVRPRVGDGPQRRAGDQPMLRVDGGSPGFRPTSTGRPDRTQTKCCSRRLRSGRQSGNCCRTHG